MDTTRYRIIKHTFPSQTKNLNYFTAEYKWFGIWFKICIKYNILPVDTPCCRCYSPDEAIHRIEVHEHNKKIRKYKKYKKKEEYMSY